MKTIHATCIWAACFSMLLPTFVSAQAPEATQTNHRFVQDVSLNTQQQLTGRLVDRSGVALTDADLTLVSEDHQPIEATTDANGDFAFHGVRGGLCEIESGDFQAIYRTWVSNTAPPAATDGLLIVADNDQVARGQCNCNCNSGNCNCNCQNQRPARVRNPNPRRRKLLFAGGRIGMKAATLPFLAAGALGAANDDEEDADAEDGAEDNGDSGSAS